MTLRNFFTGRAVVIGVLLLIGLSVLGYKAYFPAPKNTETSEINMQTNIEPPIFSWKYEQDDSLNGDGNPKTNIFLEAKYSNGAIENKLIDTTSGSCNDLPDSEEGSVPNTTNIQCYYAGLGYVFKITTGEKSYLVERKMFEEGTPDYVPPPSQYEVVAEFPFVK